MPRISEHTRLAVVDAHLGHWEQVDNQQGLPLELVAGYGRAELQVQRDAYHDQQEAISQLESDLQLARSTRDTQWGLSSDDDNGVWSRLKQYKPLVRARLGSRHPLSRTVPNLGKVRPYRYVDILDDFLDHWSRVNGVLEPDLTLGPFAITDLQTAHDDLEAQVSLIARTESAGLPLAREVREQLFGDEAEDVREDTSILARLVLYHATINAMFAGQPLADSLPDLFPAGSSGTLPTFRFNWNAQPDGSVNTWLENPDLTAATSVFLKEGVVEQTQPLDPDAGDVALQTWTGLTVIDELDQLELLNADGSTVATGVFDSDLADPSPPA